jgi:hypothetical protein
VFVHVLKDPMAYIGDIILSQATNSNVYMDREKSKIKVEENLGKWWSYLLSSPLTLSQVIYRP